jgi:DNA polymerase I-like protein with 3'-5' exonuclease and polymerase domains
MAGQSLAWKTGVSIYEANEIIARVRSRFHRFEEFSESVLDHAGLELGLMTPLGWRMRCPPASNPRTLRNFPIQSTGAEILHVLMVLAERRGIGIVAPIHDAILAEGDASDAADFAEACDRAMRDASAIVLKGFELPSDFKILTPGDCFEEERGRTMWETVNRLLAKRALGAA